MNVLSASYFLQVLRAYCIGIYQRSRYIPKAKLDSTTRASAYSFSYVHVQIRQPIRNQVKIYAMTRHILSFPSNVTLPYHQSAAE